MSRKTFNVVAVTAVAISAVYLLTLTKTDAAGDKAPAASAGPDQQPILQSAAAFTQAFNSGDAKAIAAQFLADGEYVDVDGTVIAGRTEIEAEFAAIIENNPGAKIETEVESVRFLAPGVAIEDGSTRVWRPGDDLPTVGRYSVTHVRHDGNWQIARVQELEEPPRSNYQQLKELEWMVGDWVDESEDSVVTTSCRWSKNKNFLLRNFKVRIAGQDTIEGSTRIGWDPLTKQIKSWVFDTEGGYAEGLWTRDGDRWIVKSTGVLRDGSAASATHVFTYLDSKTCTWESVDRIVGGEVAPNIEQVTIVRRPPQPKS